MKLSATAILCCLLASAEALKTKASYERSVYWAAYQAETLTGDRTIAPGCAGSATGGRCTLGELAHYIWAPPPNKPEAKNPGVDYFKKILDGVNPEKMKSQQTANLLFKADKVGNVDSAKLVPAVGSLTTDRWYEALKQVGKPVAEMYQSALDREAAALGNPDLIPELVEKAKVTALEKNLFSFSKEASNTARLLRAKDVDEYRMKPGGVQLDYGKPIITKKSDRPALKGEPAWDTLDAEATAKANAKSSDPGDIADEMDELMRANDNYMARPGQASAHAKALNSAETVFNNLKTCG